MAKRPSHAETKRLRRSVNRRRIYVNNLRQSAKDLRSGDPSDDSFDFARRIDGLADSELALARDEEARAAAMDAEILRPLDHGYSSDAARDAAERAMAAMKGRFAVDRVKAALDALGIVTSGNGMAGDLTQLECRLGIEHAALPQTGARLRIVEERLAQITGEAANA